jgi:hypothetical protein
MAGDVSSTDRDKRFAVCRRFEWGFLGVWVATVALAIAASIIGGDGHGLLLPCGILILMIWSGYFLFAGWHMLSRRRTWTEFYQARHQRTFARGWGELSPARPGRQAQLNPFVALMAGVLGLAGALSMRCYSPRLQVIGVGIGSVLFGTVATAVLILSLIFGS